MTTVAIYADMELSALFSADPELLFLDQIVHAMQELALLFE